MTSSPSWLVRTRELVLRGPFSRAALISMITKGELHPQDEIRSGEGYWIFLRESEELQKQLGVSMPNLFNGNRTALGVDEATEPEILTKASQVSPKAKDSEALTKVLTSKNRFLDTLVSFPWLIGILFFFLAMMIGKLLQLVRGPDF